MRGRSRSFVCILRNECRAFPEFICIPRNGCRTFPIFVCIPRNECKSFLMHRYVRNSGHPFDRGDLGGKNRRNVVLGSTKNADRPGTDLRLPSFLLHAIGLMYSILDVAEPVKSNPAIL